MKTYSPKAEDIKREWYVIDAKGKIVGRLATKIADILRGKHKPTFSPHLDSGDFVIVLNAKEIKFTGGKMNKKVYYHHTRFGNGLKATTPDRLIRTEKPEEILRKAVAGMISQSKLKKAFLKKLKIYPGTEHKHEAQEPKPLEL